MQTDIEMGMAKVRYQVAKEENMKIEDESDGETSERKRKRKLTPEEREELENMEKLEAEGRRVYDPINKLFDHGNKRTTDLAENKKVSLPKPCDSYTESSIEVLRQKI